LQRVVNVPVDDHVGWQVVMPRPSPLAGHQGRADVLVEDVHPLADGSADPFGLPPGVAGELAYGKREGKENHGQCQKSSFQVVLYANPSESHSWW